MARSKPKTKSSSKITDRRDNSNMRGKQGRADNDSRRINMDNARVAAFIKKAEQLKNEKPDSKKCDTSNDPNWYANSPELMRAAASLSFFNPVGMKTELATSADAPLAGTSAPGVCVISWSPYIEGASGAALAQATNSIYSYTVHANSRRYTYAPQDEMLLILAGTQVFSALACGLRAYGIMRRYNGVDMYTPEALVRAMGFEYSDLRGNLAQMWFDLNELIAASRQIWIPNTMPIINRWFWMCSNVYRDADSAKSQYYLYKPAQLYVYDEVASQQGGQLTPIAWSGSNYRWTWSTYVGNVRSMINALLNSEDRGIIFGDILNAYGADRIFALGPITSEYSIEPQYEPEVLTQFENATFALQYPGAITQVEGDKMFHQSWNMYDAATAMAAHLGRPAKSVLNFHGQYPTTPENVMVATRMTTLGSVIGTVSADSKSASIVPYAAGTEVAFTCSIYYWDYSSGTKTLTSIGIGDHSGVDVAGEFKRLQVWAAFDWAPWYVLCNPTWSAWPENVAEGLVADSTYYTLLGDYDNYVYLDKDELKKMHDCAVYSLFGVPMSL